MHCFLQLDGVASACAPSTRITRSDPLRRVCSWASRVCRRRSCAFAPDFSRKPSWRSGATEEHGFVSAVAPHMPVNHVVGVPATALVAGGELEQEVNAAVLAADRTLV